MLIAFHESTTSDGRIDLFLQKRIANMMDTKATAAPNSSIKYAVIKVVLVIGVKND